MTRLDIVVIGQGSLRAPLAASAALRSRSSVRVRRHSLVRETLSNETSKAWGEIWRTQAHQQGYVEALADEMIEKHAKALKILADHDAASE